MHVAKIRHQEGDIQNKFQIWRNNAWNINTNEENIENVRNSANRTKSNGRNVHHMDLLLAARWNRVYAGGEVQADFHNCVSGFQAVHGAFYSVSLNYFWIWR